MGCAFGEVLAEELTGRFFTERPSNMRLVQCYMYMSKQLPMSEWAPDSWVSIIAKAFFYARMLRSAATIGC